MSAMNTTAAEMMNLEEGNHSSTRHPFSPNPKIQATSPDIDPILKTHVQNPITTTATSTKKATNWLLLILHCFLTIVGIAGGPLVIRLYYIHGGSRKWLISCMQTAGFPILLFPLTLLYILQSKRKTQDLITPNKSSSISTSTPFFMEPRLFVYSAGIGVLLGVGNFMYALGLNYLPVSTATLLSATQLAFIAAFSWLIVKQKLTAFTINAVVLMTLGSILLGIRSGGDRSSSVTKAQYLLGFLLTLLSAALAGLTMPLIELSYSKVTRTLNYTFLLQFQFTAAMFSTIFNIIGMLINKDFQAIPKEASEYGLGIGMYSFVLAITAVACQLSSLGGVGLILYSSSLFGGVFMSVLLPFTEIAAVIAYHENFTAEKGMALALSVWGFINYFYGEYRTMKVVNSTTKP